MKKIIFALSLIALFVVACGEKKSANATQDPESIEVQKQVKVIDSTIKEIETIKKDIEESSDNLDKLLKDL